MTATPSNTDIPVRASLVEDPIRPTLFRLALPVFFEQVLVFCVGFFDTFLSGRIDSLSTVSIGIAAYVSWFAALLFSLVAIGTTALVARHWGAGEFDDARKITQQSLTLAVAIGFIGSAMIFFGVSWLVPLLNVDPQNAGIVIRYLRIDACGYIGTAISLVAAAALRGSGDTKTPMWVLGFVNVMNMVFSPAFVFGIGPWPALGLDGIVAGTVLARLSGGVLMLIVLLRGVSGLKITVGPRFNRLECRRILRIGIPAGIDGATMWTGHFLFLMIISRLSNGNMQSATFAAHVVGINIEAITYLPASAWGQAAATLIGQALGANLTQRARDVGHEAVKQCGTLAIFIAVFFFFAAQLIYTFMHNDPEVAKTGVPAFRMLSFFQLPLVVGIIYVMSLRGAGQTRAPLWITLFCVMGIRLPVAYFVGLQWNGGLMGAWLGMCLDVLARALISAAYFRYGRWTETKV